jgi:hypothetical protein
VTESDTPETLDGSDPAETPAKLRPPTPLEILDRYLPFIAVGAMVVTFLLLPQPFAIALIAIVWLGATRVTSNRKFLGMTLTEALAWSATIVIAILVLALALYALGYSVA